jgi:hypothetical protein
MGFCVVQHGVSSKMNLTGSFPAWPTRARFGFYLDNRKRKAKDDNRLVRFACVPEVIILSGRGPNLAHRLSLLVCL